MRRALVGVSLMSDSMESRAPSAVLRLDDFAHQHEKRDHAGGFVIAGGKRREHRDGNEFVDAQTADLQVLDRRDDDRDSRE